jgi:hypothetical protein
MEVDTCKVRLGSVRHRFLSGILSGEMPVMTIPYIGRFFRNRINERGIHTIDDLVQRLRPLNRDQMDRALTQLLQNPRKNRCVNSPHVPMKHNPAADGFYHVADVNRCAYNKVIDVLRFAHRAINFERYGFSQRATFPSLPPKRRMGTARDDGSRSCGCYHGRRRQCLAAGCRWNVSGGQTHCLPPAGQTKGFEGLGDYKGQRQEERPGAAQGGLHYRGGWRVPGNTPTRAVTAMFY